MSLSLTTLLLFWTASSALPAGQAAQAASADSVSPQGPSLNYDAIYSDMDGTLLDGSHGVRPATVEALKDFLACGGKLGLASGRTLAQVKPYLKTLHPNLPLILSNGAVAYSPDGGSLLWAYYLDPEVVRNSVELGGGVKGVQGAVVQELEKDLVDRSEPGLQEFLKKSHMPDCKVDRTLATSYKGQALKVMFIVKDRKAAEALQSKLQTPLKGKAVVMVTSGRTVEVVSETTDKSVGILRALTEAKLSPERTVVFGDGENDAGMVAKIGLGVAMANCRPITCDAADIMIGPASTDSIAKFIRSLVLTSACTQ